MTCQLYIDGQLADLSDDSLILWTYSFEDVTMPTNVRNSYTKEVTLAGTPRNNAIFYHIYRNDFVWPVAGGSLGDYNGDFNIDFLKDGGSAPITKRIPFVIYNDNSEILVSGYLKLSNIRKAGERVTYTVTLYGELGEFLLGLTYKSNGDKMTLADLEWYIGATPVSFGSSTFDRSLVAEGWEWLVSAVTPSTHPWLKAVNFAPCYNGLPDKEDFDADRVLVDLNTVTTLGIPSNATVDGVTYAAHNGFVLAQLPDGYTEQEILDCRAHLQRPVVKIEHFFDTIKASGDYTVVLDSAWFTNTNPYYKDAWMTLPMVKDNDYVTPEIQNDTKTATGSSPWGWNGLTTTKAFNFTDTLRVSSRPALNVRVQIQATTYGCGIADGYFGLVFLRYYDTAGNQITTARSALFVLYSSSAAPSSTGIGNALALQGESLSDFSVIYSQGRFGSDGYWTGTNTQNGVLPIRVDEVTNLGQVCIMGYVPDQMAYSGTAVALTKAEVTLQGGLYGYPLAGRTVSKQTLLGGTATPADYLLSYCKQFNLRMVVDEAEKKVTIMRSSTFFTGNVIDINDRIDRKKELDIQPLLTDKRWFTMTQAVDGANAKRYDDYYGRPYGRVRIDTSYPFNEETQELCENNVLRGAVQTQAKSRKMAYPLQGSATRRSWQEYAHTLVYGIAGASTEVSQEGFSASAYTAYNSDGLIFYDDTDRPQLCDEGGKALDGSGVLLFLDGSGGQVWLTDDTSEQLYQNASNACWMITEDATIAEHIHQPRFSRFYGSPSVSQIMEYAVPSEIYTTLPTSVPATAGVYAECWQAMMGDRYDDNTRVVTCWVSLKGWKVCAELLRPFYWFDNALWVLNKISDYNMGREGATKCEFIRVNDPTNYSDDYGS